MHHRPRRIHRGTILALDTLRCLSQGVLMLLLFSLVSGLLRSTVEQHLTNRQNARLLEQKQAYLAQLEQERAALAAKVAFLRSPAGIVAEARRLNWIRPDERRIWFVEPAAGPPAPTESRLSWPPRTS